MIHSTMERALLVLIAVVALVAGGYFLWQGADSPAAEPQDPVPAVVPEAQAPTVAPADGGGGPASTLPAQTPRPVPVAIPDGRRPGRYPGAVPFNRTGGIPIGDGTYLPLLNGVPHAPPVIREGPMPPVIARVIDHEGFEWYEHADGSMTTSRWNEYAVLDPKTGQHVVNRQVFTEHGEVLPDRAEVPVPEDRRR